MPEETNRIEYKRELSDASDKFEKDVVSFLNSHEGGVIFIGIDDDGTPVGVEKIDKIQCKIANRIRDNISPSTMGLFDEIIVLMSDKKVIKVDIASGREKPYFITKKGMAPSGCFLRIGSSAQHMSMNLIEELFSKRTRNSLSKIDSPRQDLGFEQLKIYFEEAGMKLNEQFTNNLELLTSEGHFNYVAYLLADNNGVSIKIARYAGTLKEAVINAIVHNDYFSNATPVFEVYSDRITVTSIGNLADGMSKEDFFAGYSMPRNRELMRIFKDVRLVEQLGSGIQRILKAYEKNVFTFTNAYIKVTFLYLQDFGNRGINTSLYSKTEVAEINDTILQMIDENNRISVDEIAKKIGLNRRSILRRLQKLQDDGKILRVGSSRAGHWEKRE